MPTTLIDPNEWLVTEGNQFIVVGEFRRGDDGKVQFVDRERKPLPVPVWAIANMLKAYASGEFRSR